MAKTLPWFALFAVAAAFGWPMLQEGTTSVCGAVEIKAMRLSRMAHMGGGDGYPLADIMINGLQTLMNGSVATAAARERYPDLPPLVGCSFLYWRLGTRPDPARP